MFIRNGTRFHRKCLLGSVRYPFHIYQDNSISTRDLPQTDLDGTVKKISPINREVICSDAIKWLEDSPDYGLMGSVFTSLPDISELPPFHNDISNSVGVHKQINEIKSYKKWFRDTVGLILSKLPTGSYAIFLQSDVRVQDKLGNVIDWIDKSYLCSCAAETTGCAMLWHKISIINSVDHPSTGRPTYSHLLCYARQTGYKHTSSLTPDVFHRGDMVWPRAIGLDSCILGLEFLKASEVQCVIDPFCGQGTVLAVANAFGMKSIGVDLSAKRCRKARLLQLEDSVLNLTPSRRRLLSGKILDKKFVK